MMPSSSDESSSPHRHQAVLPNQSKRKRTLSPQMKPVTTLSQPGAVRPPKPKLPPHVHAQLSEANLRIASLETNIDGVLQGMKNRIRALEKVVHAQRSELATYKNSPKPLGYIQQDEMSVHVTNLKAFIQGRPAEKQGQPNGPPHQQVQVILERVGILASGHPATRDHVDAIKEMFESYITGMHKQHSSTAINYSENKYGIKLEQG